MITLYVLQSRTSGRRYVGITNDLVRRLAEHRRGQTAAGRLLRDFELVLSESFPDHVTARKREKYLKSGQGREWLRSAVSGSGLASGE
ncbi:MAG: GIY-YIG nuclease family protein [Kiritimatiellae bacterium]|nr:GIY-YIG nuclease family protein [Kiritimatiellia bacterium]